jgi:hypothetical protein
MFTIDVSPLAGQVTVRDAPAPAPDDWGHPAVIVRTFRRLRSRDRKRARQHRQAIRPAVRPFVAATHAEPITAPQHANPPPLGARRYA